MFQKFYEFLTLEKNNIESYGISRMQDLAADNGQLYYWLCILD